MSNNNYQQLFRYYAEKYPKSSTFALLVGTAATLAAGVIAVEMRDARDASRYAEKMEKLNYGEGYSNNPTVQNNNNNDPKPSLQEAQLKAMLENARNSSWKENLQNAADAQARFMLPGRASEEIPEPEYIRRIDKRSVEILREEKEKAERREMELEEERRGEKDLSKTSFWK